MTDTLAAWNIWSKLNGWQLLLEKIKAFWEERKVENEKPRKKFVSPPPSVVIDQEEDSAGSINDVEEKEDNTEVETHHPLKPAPLLHSASFFAVNKKVDCPQTPSQNRKENPCQTKPDYTDDGL